MNGSSRTLAPMPGLHWGSYPERPARDNPQRMSLPLPFRLLADHAASHWHRMRQPAWLHAVHAERSRLAQIDPGTLAQTLAELRSQLRRDGLIPALRNRALALAMQSACDTLGELPYDTQLIAACIVLDNQLAEMATGEGKTLAIGLAASTAALAGVPVHVLTANDYLVERDAGELRPFYQRLGLSVGVITQPLSSDQRRAAYACDIVYCTASELVFDYLRDGLVRQRDSLREHIESLAAPTRQTPVMRGLCMAIVDEADSILIDEARMPLVLSQPAAEAQERRFLEQSLNLARTLRAGTDFHIDHAQHGVQLSASGQMRLEEAAQTLGSVWHNRLHREESICMALSALHLYRRDRDYLVRDGKIQIIDPNTGRISHGRIWSRGLHQFIELIEGCKPTAATVPLAQITYQRFFPRYLRLGGLSGTLTEARAELLDVYGLKIRRVPLRQPNRRLIGPPRVFAHDEALWSAVSQRAGDLHRQGRPVLIGTSSVADSEALSRHLEALGLPHTVLNARQDADEARVVAQAGEPGRITVTTNMAGRGTDISLAADTMRAGGLHVLCCQLNASRRIDRQLAGRSARQGQPGSVESWLSLASAFQSSGNSWFLSFSRYLPQRAAYGLIRLNQRLQERHQRQWRRYMREQDQRMDQKLFFDGMGS